MLVRGGNEIAEAFYEENRNKLKDENWRIIYAMRFKMMLLHYLINTPRSMGMRIYSPFLKENIAMDIVNMNWEEKAGRKWEYECFQNIDLNYSWLKKTCDYNYCLDMDVLRNVPLLPLNVGLLRQVIKPSYVEKINKLVAARPLRCVPAKPRTISNLYNKAVCKYNAPINTAVNKYCVLMAVQKLLENVEKHTGGK